MSGIMIFVDTRGFEEWLRREPMRADEALSGFKRIAGLLSRRAIWETAPEKEGRLKRSIVVEETEEGVEVYPTVHYTVFVERGVGLYGPRGSLIFPRRAKVLRFMIGDRVVFARYVRGFPGRFFIKRAAEIVRPIIFQQMSNLWREIHDV